MDKQVHWYNCETIPEFADQAAMYDRKHYPPCQNKEKHSDNGLKLQLPLSYQLHYTNGKMWLLEDIQVRIESSKASWTISKTNGKFKSESLVAAVKKEQMTDYLSHIATVSHYILETGHAVSKQIGKPVVIIYNARGATMYSHVLEDYCEYFLKTESCVHEPIDSLDVAKICEDMKNGSVISCVLPIRQFKISSHEYVQTEDEASKLSGLDPITTKVRKTYRSKLEQNKEFMPEMFLAYLKMGLPTLFIDIPSWGKYYASSTGVLRNTKDIQKQSQGIFKPYKFKSYVEYAQYQTACVSLQKIFATEASDQICIPEENISRIDMKYPFAIILNPEIENNIWWDNCPQLFDQTWNMYSCLTADTLKREYPRLNVKTNMGVMDIAKYIRQWIQGATINNKTNL